MHKNFAEKFLTVLLMVLILGLAGCATTSSNVPTVSGAVYHGFGVTSVGRLGPGRDETGTMVYSFNVAMASALFDADGKILNVTADVLEVSTPNYSGATMPHFSGWPGTEGFNVFDHATRQISGLSNNTDESFLLELAEWQTKRERGATYFMNPANDWYQQMDFYENWMIGKTVQELTEWRKSFMSPETGRPINPASTNEKDIALLAEMTDAEKAMLVDVVAGATMSLSDPHGLIIEAIVEAFENRALVFAQE